MTPPSASGESRPWEGAWWRERPLHKVVLYYLVLGAVVLLIRRYLPAVYHVLSAEALPSTGMAELTGGAVPSSPVPPSPSGLPVGVTSLITMAATMAIMMPVVSVYVATRQKKGYQQSMVQTLIILPIVVSAVVILVKNSLALAFGLGGIVGAVAFRNRLEDTKDAVYVFVAIGVGLSCGVEVSALALALSVFFNAVIIYMWYTDFGRMPGDLRMPVARRRVQVAKGMVGGGGPGKKKGELVSALDQQILQSMTPEQLEALAQRALMRQQQISTELADVNPDRFEGLIKVVPLPGTQLEQIRSNVELVLDRDAKKFQYLGTEPADDGTMLTWQVRGKKGVPGPLLLEAIRRTVLTQVRRVTLG